MKGETFSTPLDKDGTHINGKALSPFGGTYRIFFGEHEAGMGSRGVGPPPGKPRWI